uniref:Uncharacterized protein n=1 Tax=Cucumis melo TaxID=3656 RepID=A0A9I9EL95_CUCME
MESDEELRRTAGKTQTTRMIGWTWWLQWKTTAAMATDSACDGGVATDGGGSEFDYLILSRLDAYALFEEAKHLESWKKACIFKGASTFEGVLEVGVLEESLYLQKGASIFKGVLEIGVLEESCIFKGASIFKGGLEIGVLQESFWSLGRKLVSSKELQSSKVFLKLESWKKACIFKGVSIFEGVLEVGVLEESLYLQRSFNHRRHTLLELSNLGPMPIFS